MGYINKEELLNSLTKQNIIDICWDLGNGEHKEDSQGNLCFNTCLCHGGDSQGKLIYYPHIDTALYPDHKVPIFYCFTCNCVSDLIGLVIKARKLKGITTTWYQALNYIAQKVGYADSGFDPNYKKNEDDIVDDLPWINNIKSIVNKRKKSIPHLKTIPETYLEVFTYLPHEQWLNDGVTVQAMERFDISYYPLTNQIVIPHRDMDGNLIGIRGRFLDKADIENIGKYVPISINGQILSHSLGSALYGLWVTKDKIKECRKALIVEGEKSCLKAYSMFADNSYVVATCGSSISLTHQKILLNELGVEEIIYMPDKDYQGTIDSFAAKAWLQKQKKKLLPFVPYVQTYLMLDTDDTWEYKSNAFDFNDRDKFIEEYDKKMLITMDNINE